MGFFFHIAKGQATSRQSTILPNLGERMGMFRLDCEHNVYCYRLGDEAALPGSAITRIICIGRSIILHVREEVFVRHMGIMTILVCTKKKKVSC